MTSRLKCFAQGVLSRAGYRVERVRPAATVLKPGYEPVTPGASYAPWTSDDDFNRLYERIRAFTLVDKYRCFELWQLLGQMKGRQGGILEVGVWRGGTAVLIAHKARRESLEGPVYVADTFAGVVKAGAEDSCYRGGEHADASEGEVKELLAGESLLQNIRILKGVFPDETADLIPPRQLFRFCHIDVDVYRSAKGVFDWVWGRMVAGGVVVFDDYGFVTCDGVAKFVDGELRGRDDLVLIHNLNGHAIVVKTASDPRAAFPADGR